MTDAGAIPYRSRRGGLIFFGALQMVIGALSLLLVAFMIVMAVFASRHPTPGMSASPFAQLLMSSSIYLTAGILLLSLGVGSILRRRWARDLSLVVAWMWLLLGIVTTMTIAIIVPRVLAGMPSQQPGAGAVVLTCLTVMLGFFGIVIPLSLILFYRSPHVRATCIAEDPVPRWTERAPLPLLGLSTWLVFSGLAMGGMSSYAVLPLADRIITGPIAAGAYLFIAILLLYVAWGVFMRSRAAWWTGLAYGIAMTVYCLVVFPHLDYDQLTRAMGFPKTQGMPDLGAMYRSPWFLGWMAFFWIAYFGYFVFALRYFRRDEEPARTA